MTITKKELKNKIKELCYKEGDFILSSGKRSNFYFDCKKAVLNGEILKEIIKYFLEEVKEADAVGGKSIGADFLVSALLYADSRLVGTIIREPKKHGTKTKVENPIKNKKIILLDDVLTTGNSLLYAYDELKKENEIIKALVIIKREEVELPFPVKALFNIRDFIF